MKIAISGKGGVGKSLVTAGAAAAGGVESLGPSAAGGAYIPSFCDVVVMVDGRASMYLEAAAPSPV